MKSLSKAVVDPHTLRATVIHAKGTPLTSMGVTVRTVVEHKPGEVVKLDPQGVPYPKFESSQQLLPEEVLYLLERGALECFLAGSVGPQRDIPLSVQQAFSALIGPRGCTKDQYQVGSLV